MHMCVCVGDRERMFLKAYSHLFIHTALVSVSAVEGMPAGAACHLVSVRLLCLLPGGRKTALLAE